MATKTEKIAELNGKVFAVIAGTDEPIETIGELKTYDIVCLITINESGATNKVTQRLYVQAEGTPQEAAFFGGNEVKNYEAPVNVKEQQEAFFLSELKATEAAEGVEVAIVVSELQNLGINYVVYEANGVKKVRTNLAGELVIREAV